MSGGINFFQGHGIDREFYKLPGKFGIVDKCQGINFQGILKILDSSQITK